MSREAMPARGRAGIREGPTTPASDKKRLAARTMLRPVALRPVTALSGRTSSAETRLQSLVKGQVGASERLGQRSSIETATDVELSPRLRAHVDTSSVLSLHGGCCAGDAREWSGVDGSDPARSYRPRVRRRMERRLGYGVLSR